MAKAAKTADPKARAKRPGPAPPMPIARVWEFFETYTRDLRADDFQRVFTRDTPFSKRMSVGLRLCGGPDIIIGTGSAKEIEAMARAVQRVLNMDVKEVRPADC